MDLDELSVCIAALEVGIPAEAAARSRLESKANSHISDGSGVIRKY